MPVARFQMPDGRVARFEVPEGTSPEAAQAMIEKEFPNLVSQAPKAAAAQPAAPRQSQGFLQDFKDVATSPQIGSPAAMIANTAPESFKRQVGLTGRAALEGITAIPNMIGDALGLRSTQTVRDWLTKFGMPLPQGGTERVAQDVAGAMAGQGGVMKLGKMMVNATGPLIARIGDLLSMAPRSQLVGAAGAAGSAGTAREAGAGPGVQLAAGLAGGVVAPLAADVAITGTKAGLRGTKAFLEQFTQGGRERAVGGTLSRFATDPKRAMDNMATAQEIVPGSRPTTAQAARDPGLLITERGLQSSSQRAGSEFSKRASQQNTARNTLMNELAKDTDELAFLKAERGGTAEQLYQQARDVGIDQAKLTPARRGEITKLLKRPAIQSAVKQAKVLAQNEGINLKQPEGSVQGLDYVKRALDDQISKTQGNEQRILVALKNRLLTTIDELSPEYAAARKVFSDMSKPINQVEALQGVRERVLNTGTDAVTGERLLSAAKFSNVLNKPESRKELLKVLTDDQFKNLERISADLERGALSASAGRAAGSNTMQNLSVAHVIGSSLGGGVSQNPVMRTLSAPLKWISDLSGNEAALQDLLTDAMLEPALARQLMMKATPRAVESLGFELRQRAMAKGLGGLVGTAATAGRTQPIEAATAQ